MFDLIGKTIGPYRVIEQVGVGGMATVYKAYQPSMDRYVAIKILPHYLSQDPEFVKRFQREARAIAKLEHAHILPVHDYGEYEGIAYIVMRYVEAGTLKDRMAQGQLPLDEIDRLIEQIGGALDYAHRLGVIHRDIKPGNVLLDSQGDTYLSDFGLARMMEVTQQLTGSGVGVGTPAYMSPEQGQGVKVDHRSDIYSLGVILYEMVTGHVPFEAETPMAVVIKHITDPLPLPRTMAPGVPEPIELVILKALAKDPANRFQTAGEMVQALAVAVRKVSAAEAQRPPEPQRAVETERPSPTRADVSLVTRVGRLWEQPRGKVALVGGVVAVVVLIALLLSRLPGSIAIVGPGAAASTSAIAQVAGPTATYDLDALATQFAIATATQKADSNATQKAYSTGVRQTVNAQQTNAALTPSKTPTITRTPAPTRTLSPIERGEILQMCGDDVCIGGNPVGLADKYFGFWGLSWSPDGSRFVFSACLKEDAVRNPNYQCEGNIYISDREGNVTVVVTGPDFTRMPAWSLDGEWIVYEDNNSIAIIRPDGTGRKTIVGNSSACLGDMAWSPDSQRIAWLEDRFCNFGTGALLNYVWIINRNGSGRQTIFQSTDPLLVHGLIAWSPDGQAVAVMLQNGVAYQINADCNNLPNRCDESSRTKLDAFPEYWLSNFYPQWAGENIEGAALSTATPTP